MTEGEASWRRRVAISVGLTAVALVLTWLPLPFAQEAAMEQGHFSTPVPSSGSVLVQVWDATAIYAFIVGVFVAPVARARWASAEGAVGRGFVLGAVLVAAMLAGLMIALPMQALLAGSYRYAAEVLGWPFRVEVISTVVGVAALHMLLARGIDGLGVGPGFAWIVVALSVGLQVRGVAERLSLPDGAPPVVYFVWIVGLIWLGYRLGRNMRPSVAKPGWLTGGFGGGDLSIATLLLWGYAAGAAPVGVARNAVIAVSSAVGAGILAALLRRSGKVLAAEARYRPGARVGVAAIEAGVRSLGRGRAALLGGASALLTAGAAAAGLPASVIALSVPLVLAGGLLADILAARDLPDHTVPVWYAQKVYEVDPAMALLERAGISCLPRGLPYRLLRPLALYVPITLLVRPEDAARAAELLAKVPPPDESPLPPEPRPDLKLAPTSGDSIWTGPTMGPAS